MTAKETQMFPLSLLVPSSFAFYSIWEKEERMRRGLALSLSSAQEGMETACSVPWPCFLIQLLKELFELWKFWSWLRCSPNDFLFMLLTCCLLAAMATGFAKEPFWHYLKKYSMDHPLTYSYCLDNLFDSVQRPLDFSLRVREGEGGSGENSWRQPECSLSCFSSVFKELTAHIQPCSPFWIKGFSVLGINVVTCNPYFLLEISWLSGQLRYRDGRSSPLPPVSAVGQVLMVGFLDVRFLSCCDVTFPEARLPWPFPREPGSACTLNKKCIRIYLFPKNGGQFPVL